MESEKSSKASTRLTNAKEEKKGGRIGATGVEADLSQKGEEKRNPSKRNPGGSQISCNKWGTVVDGSTCFFLRRRKEGKKGGLEICKGGGARYREEGVNNFKKKKGDVRFCEGTGAWSEETEETATTAGQR